MAEPQEQAVVEVAPLWSQEEIYGKTYLGARVTIALPCGHEFKSTISPSCVYTRSDQSDREKLFHTKSDLHSALDAGCAVCGTVFRPLGRVVEKVNGILVKESSR